jgi:hypothetical protein
MLNELLDNLESNLKYMLSIAEEMRSIMTYTSFALDHDDMERFERLIVARDIEIEKYEQYKLKYQAYLDSVITETGMEEDEILEEYMMETYKTQIKDIFVLLYRKDQENIKKVSSKVDDSKKEVKKIKLSRKATNSYYGMHDGFSGSRFDSKR